MLNRIQFHQTLSLMSRSSNSVFLWLLLWSAASFHSSLSCDFPSDLQTTLQGREWEREWSTQIRNQFTELGTQIQVDGNTIRTNSDGSSHTRTCQTIVGGDKYLVRHEEGRGQGQMFTCLQFLFKTRDIFQMKLANLSQSMSHDLCSDANLRLDKWLVVDKTIMSRGGQPCPLSGGFNVRVFDKLRGRGICDAYEGEIRFESDCSAGDGLTFYFRTQKCVPEGMMMRGTQKTICLASWNESSHTFVLLRHHMVDDNYAWLLRHPNVNQDTFSTYLFHDLFADTKEHVTENLNYLRMDTRHEGPRNLTTLCEDDYEICEGKQMPCARESQTILMTCPRSCGLCSRSPPVFCSLPEEWSGEWYDIGNDGLQSSNVSINATNMIMASNKGSSLIHNYRCVQWQESRSTSGMQRTTEIGMTGKTVMLVLNYSNGCKPQYMCLKVLQQSEAFLYVNLSRGLKWPLTKNSTEPITCETIEKHHYEFYSHSKILFNPQIKQARESCNFPKEVNGSLQVRFRNGSECSGKISERNNKTELKLNLTGCRHNPLPDTSSLTCLKSFRISPSSDLVIFAKPAQSDILYCWLFPKHQLYPFYLLIGSRCAHMITRKEKPDMTSYDAVFSQKVPKSTTPPTVSSTLSTLPLIENTSEQTTTTIELTVREESTLATPQSYIVLGIVALLLAIVQVIIFCRCC